MTRLFESPEFIVDRFDDEHISDGTWYIFGIASGYFGELLLGDLPRADISRCIHSVASMYKKCFDQVCGRRGADVDADLADQVPVDTAVYMIWDMDSLEGSLYMPAFQEAGFGVVEQILMTCVTSTCQMSALHALGEVCKLSDTATHTTQSLIDQYLSKRHPPEWLRDYALAAREGKVL